MNNIPPTMQSQYQQLGNKAPVVYQTQLMRAFRVVTIIFTVIYLFALVERSALDVAGATLITIAALLPLYLWCRGRAGGMPIYPLYALSFIWAYAFPLLSKHHKVFLYDIEDRLLASILVTVFLITGTVAWYRITRYSHPPARTYKTLREDKGDVFFLFILVSALLFTISSNQGWLLTMGGGFSIIRGVVLGMTALAVFVLSCRLGAGKLSRNVSIIFWVVMPMFLIANIISLLLIGAMTTCVLAVVAYTIGKNKIPWITLVLIAIVFSMLHSGKGDMREQYWGYRDTARIDLIQYPNYIAEWIGYSFKQLNIAADSSSTGQNMFERASLLHLFLKVQDESPDKVPYLLGATYSVIPELLIPRIFKENKIASHESTYLLNIHYGMQTRENTLTTTIAWGLLNEAYANFGYLGCIGLAIVLGSLYGKVSSWSMNYPTLSLRSLVALLFLAFSMQAEFTSGVLVAALFQSLIVLGGVSFIFMKNQYTSYNI